jgi:opacity protein-like surface antigen
MTRAMRFVIALGVFLLVPISAQAQDAGAIAGFGGVSISGTSTSTMPDLGGNVSFRLTPGIEVIAEAGRVGNVLPSLADTIFSATNSGLRASAFYGEGGIRFRLAPHARVSPYAEATAGMSRLDVTSTRLGPVAGGLTSAAIAFLGRNGPVAGAGGGVLVSAGSVVFDVGYRYKQFFPPDALGMALGFGETLSSHQLRAGVGVRF